MRIAMISTPFVPVPPPQYGGTELIVSELVDGLTTRGHEVTLFTCGQSSAPCEVRSLYDCARWPPDPYPELDHAAWSIEQILGSPREFDVVHAHIPAAVPFARLMDVPMVYTVHHERELRLVPLYQRASVQFVAISERQRMLAPELSAAMVIHHGLDPARYAFGAGQGGYVGFLGRFAARRACTTRSTRRPRRACRCVWRASRTGAIRNISAHRCSRGLPSPSPSMDVQRAW